MTNYDIAQNVAIFVVFSTMIIQRWMDRSAFNQALSRQLMISDLQNRSIERIQRTLGFSLRRESTSDIS